MSHVEPLQRQAFQRYYSLYWHAFYLARFSEPTSSTSLQQRAGAQSALPTVPLSALRTCTRAQFDALLLEQLRHRPTQGMRWLRACAVTLTGQRAHPLAVLLAEHDEGRRQGYRGRMQQATPRSTSIAASA